MKRHRNAIYAFCLLSSMPILLLLGSNLCLTQEEPLPFVVALEIGPTTLDPADAFDTVSINTVMQVCEGLYMNNYSSPEMEVIPCLAESKGTWDPTMHNLTVPLKQNVTFHDGTHFNASAVKWIFDRLQYMTDGFDIDGDGELEATLEIASWRLFRYNNTAILNRTEILDEYAVKFVLNQPCIIWEKLLAFVATFIFLPDSGYSYGMRFLNRITLTDALIGTGPFMLTEYEFENQVVFDYYPGYHLQWGDNHIERMIYLIIPDPVTSSLAVLNHEVHWGGVIADYCCQFNPDPDLVRILVKRTTVYYIGMNVVNIPGSIRYASSFCFNFTYYLSRFVARHYELHVPIPDGMQYHLEGFEGEPEYDMAKARDILLTSADAGIAANITFNNLSVSNTTAEWRAVAESTHPVAWYNFTRYPSSTILRTATQLQDNLKDIGIRLEILDPYNIFIYSPLPSDMSYFFRGWGPDYNDPINMIEPLYGYDLRWYSTDWSIFGRCGWFPNYFQLNDTYFDGLLNQTYRTSEMTNPTRRELFYEIQEYFVREIVPSFYILQAGDEITFNREWIRENSTGDLLNIFGHYYWFRVQITPQPFPPAPKNPWRYLLYYGIPSVMVIGIGSTFWIKYKPIRASKEKRMMYFFEEANEFMNASEYKLARESLKKASKYSEALKKNELAREIEILLKQCEISNEFSKKLKEQLDHINMEDYQSAYDHLIALLKQTHDPYYEGYLDKKIISDITDLLANVSEKMGNPKSK